jgi:hypothetical protein
MKWQNIFSTAATLLLSSFSSFSQVSVAGPACVTAGIEYQYNISANPDAVSASGMEICITGGTVAGWSSNCKSGLRADFIRVIWNYSTESGKIIINSSRGNASKIIRITESLNAGHIDSSALMQVIDFNMIPSPIPCTPASGGDCQRNYKYHWQLSYDEINWSDMQDVTSQNLVFTAPLIKNTYYRRKVTQPGSDIEEYSNTVNVYVKSANDQ